jgi:hypothetical protein
MKMVRYGSALSRFLSTVHPASRSHVKGAGALMSPYDYLSLAEAVLIDGPQSSSSWAAIEMIRKAREMLPAPLPDPLEAE